MAFGITRGGIASVDVNGSTIDRQVIFSSLAKARGSQYRLDPCVRLGLWRDFDLGPGAAPIDRVAPNAVGDEEVEDASGGIGEDAS